MGLSPRVRGNLRSLDLHELKRGSIPACAGEPKARSVRLPGGRVYPRVCGGTQRVGPAPNGDMGLSPRVRGNRPWDHWRADRRGSIPACAGEPFGRLPSWPDAWVYPRVCGGTCVASLVGQGKEGLSPRVRGNLQDRRAIHPAPGSIPACAGEPQVGIFTRYPPGVYPRVCGGTSVGSITVESGEGLSPRVRGNPSIASSKASSTRVYPRVCGGTVKDGP